MDYLLLTLISVTFVLYLVITSLQRPRNLPPGPRSFVPILGHLYGLSPDNMIQKLREYRKQYGDLYSLRFGSKTVIVVNGYETLKDVFVKNADAFSDRPNIFMINIFEGHGMITTSGDLWKEHRKFALGSLRNFGFGKKSFETNILEEVEILIALLEETKGDNFDISYLIHTCVSNVICSVVFGRRFEHTDPVFVKLLDLVDESIRLGGVAGPLNFIPFVKYLPKDPFNCHLLMKNMEDIDLFMSDVIRGHTESYERGNQRDFIDAFLDEKIKRPNDTNNTFTDKQLLKTVEEFFVAGTETTATTLRWALIYLINYPKIQERMRKEIETVVGTSNFPSYKNRTSLPFCEAVITEVLRCGEILPFSLAHGVSRDTIYKGYNIPKEAVLIPNLDSVMMDDTLFPEPTKFNPDRFIDEQGNFCSNDRVIPFSLGRRSCLGESLARMELFLFLTTMVQRFSFKPANGEPPPQPEGILGVTRSPKPFLMRTDKIL